MPNIIEISKRTDILEKLELRERFSDFHERCIRMDICPECGNDLETKYERPTYALDPIDYKYCNRCRKEYD